MTAEVLEISLRSLNPSTFDFLFMGAIIESLQTIGTCLHDIESLKNLWKSGPRLFAQNFRVFGETLSEPLVVPVLILFNKLMTMASSICTSNSQS